LSIVLPDASRRVAVRIFRDYAEAVKLFLDWVDFRTEARTVQYQIAIKRLKPDAKASTGP